MRDAVAHCELRARGAARRTLAPSSRRARPTTGLLGDRASPGRERGASSGPSHVDHTVGKAPPAQQAPPQGARTAPGSYRPGSHGRIQQGRELGEADAGGSHRPGGSPEANSGCDCYRSTPKRQGHALHDCKVFDPFQQAIEAPPARPPNSTSYDILGCRQSD